MEEFSNGGKGRGEEGDRIEGLGEVEGKGRM